MFLSLVALVGVLVFGVLPGLLVAAGLSLVIVVKRLSRPVVGAIVRDPATGAWGMADRHPDWHAVPGFLVARVEGPLFYANVMTVKEQLLEAVRREELPPKTVVLELAESPDLDVETLDTLGELADALAAEGIELQLATVRARALGVLARSGLGERVRTSATVDEALGSGREHSG